MTTTTLARIAFVLFTVFAGVTLARADEAAPKQVLYVIPHSHWEGAVFKTREEYLQMGLPNILRALQLLKKHPEYRFVLERLHRLEGLSKRPAPTRRT
jgi:hypothetical protein